MEGLTPEKILWLKEVQPIKPLQIDKSDWRGWVVLNKQKDFGLLQKCRI